LIGLSIAANVYEIWFVNQQLSDTATGRNFEVMVDQFNADEICTDIKCFKEM